MAKFGFIHDKLDIKLLVLYLMDRVAAPIDFATLTDLSLCDSGVDYFQFAEAVSELPDSGPLDQQGAFYAITDKGRRNSQICESSLPRSVRRRCDGNLVKVNEALRREAQIRSQIMDNSDGTVTLCLTMEDGASPLLHLALLAADGEQAARWAQVFQADPSALYLGITKLLDQPKKEETT